MSAKVRYDNSGSQACHESGGFSLQAKDDSIDELRKNVAQIVRKLEEKLYRFRNYEQTDRELELKDEIRAWVRQNSAS